MIVARRIRVTGRVQGVFFRAWTRQKAEALGVTGWVRNCEDGSVEAHLEGDEKPVKQLIEKLRNGPPSAQVENVCAEDAGVEGLAAFRVSH